jgi:choline dehydrogenase-like flavoprotein
MNHMYDLAIVGSGMGGATLARSLAATGKDILVLEQGVRESTMGSFRDTLRYFDGNKLTRMPKKSNEGVILWRTLMAGGSTMVACANGVRCLERELAEHGIELEPEFAEIEKDTGTALIDEILLSEGSHALLEASRELGYRMERMPKFIDAAKCDKCGGCVMGCRHGAKWTALDFVDAAQAGGVEIAYGVAVDHVDVEGGRATGVTGRGPSGGFHADARNVVLAAGGLGSPVILQRSGIQEAGRGLFLDLFVDTYGKTNGLNQAHEPQMALVDTEFHETEGFLLSPYVNGTKAVRAIEVGPEELASSTLRMLGVMAKTTDDRAGRVFPDGSVSKPVTDADWKRLRRGHELSREILERAGADPKSIRMSKVQGAHPGGTAAIGTVVDRDLRTKIDGLFVCDASVLPATPGMPPMLTIGALAKRLAKTLAPSL